MPPRFLLVLLLVAGAFPMPAGAQPARRSDDPALACVYPAGGCAGTTFEVTVSGQRLINVFGAQLTLPGASVEVVGFDRPMPQRELNFIENNLTLLQTMRTAANGRAPGWTPEDKRLLDALQSERDTKRPNRQMPNTLAETVTLRITLPKNTPAGQAELRLASPSGLSNPLVFQIGCLPEFVEPPSERGRSEIPGRDTVRTLDIELPALINGRIMPADTDRFRFHARRGQRLAFAVSARTLIPYLADAVPGWFQATLALKDATGRELAFNDDFRYNPDPALVYEVERDGEYVLEITDALHRGREDFVYRIAAGEIPCVTGIFPAGGDGSKSTAVRLHGWNLPKPAAALIDAGPAGAIPLPLERGLVAAMPLDFCRGTGPEINEREPNDLAKTAQAVSLPVVVNGTISSPDDIDRFRVSARQGDEIIAEVNARRLGSPLDSVVTIGTPDGGVLASNDDHNDPSAGLVTHQADSLLSFTAPSDGAYIISIRDAAGQGGEDFVYRLRISPPQPAFTVEFTPSSFLIRPGGRTELGVHVVRRDGYAGPVSLSLDKAPAGLRLAKDAVVPAGKDKGVFSLNASSTLLDGVYEFSLAANTVIDGNDVTVAVIPADDRMQAFLPRHLVPARKSMVLIARSAGWKQAPRAAVEGSVKIPLGGEVRFTLPIPVLKGVNLVALQLRECREGVTLSAEPCVPGQDLKVAMRCDGTRLRTGMQGSFVLAVLAEDAVQPISGGRLLGQLPPMSFEIVATAPNTDPALPRATP